MIALSNARVASMIAAIYMGLILGVSFFAAPIKFMAKGVEQEQLLAVGKVSFQAFTWVEFVAFTLLVVSTFGVRTNKVVLSMFLLFSLLIIQKFAVLPILDAELDRTAAGEIVEGSNLHSAYVAIECIKLLVLFYLALMLGNDKSVS